MRTSALLLVLFLVLLCPFRALGGTAVQTNWTGGDGITGPVMVWGDEFFEVNFVDFMLVPGALKLAGTAAVNTVSSDFDGARIVRSVDIDGDGDFDVVGGALRDGDYLVWWENTDGMATSWEIHGIDSDYSGVNSVYPADFDGDDDIDLVGACAASLNTYVRWWENEDGSGGSWAPHIIDSDFYGCMSVIGEDVDGDGDLDVLGSCSKSDEICWWENTDGSGAFETEHEVTNDFDGAWKIYTDDVDGDGDPDIIGAARYGDEVAWWENVDGSGIEWTKHLIASGFVGANCVCTLDFDKDGDRDVVASAISDRTVVLWENSDGSGTSWTEQVIATDVTAYSLYPHDIDDDHYTDIVAALYQSNRVVWWENPGGASAWITHVVDGSFQGAADVWADDMDGDGTRDILGAAFFGESIAWWGASEHPAAGSLMSSVLDVGEPPDWGSVTWNADVPAGTTVWVSLRASDDFREMGSWSNPLTEPGSLEGILTEGDNYVQYRVSLQTGDPAVSPLFRKVTISWDPMGIEGGGEPAEFGLLPFSPNPSPVPAARLSIPEPASVGLTVYDLSGRAVLEVPESDFTAGFHTVSLTDMTPGIYFCRMRSGEFTAARRFAVVR